MALPVLADVDDVGSGRACICARLVWIIPFGVYAGRDDELNRRLTSMLMGIRGGMQESRSLAVEKVNWWTAELLRYLAERNTAQALGRGVLKLICFLPHASITSTIATQSAI